MKSLMLISAMLMMSCVFDESKNTELQVNQNNEASKIIVHDTTVHIDSIIKIDTITKGGTIVFDTIKIQKTIQLIDTIKTTIDTTFHFNDTTYTTKFDTVTKVTVIRLDTIKHLFKDTTIIRDTIRTIVYDTITIAKRDTGYSTFTDSRDGKVYRTYKFPNGTEWFTTPLRYNPDAPSVVTDRLVVNSTYTDSSIFGYKQSENYCPIGYRKPLLADVRDLFKYNAFTYVNNTFNQLTYYTLSNGVIKLISQKILTSTSYIYSVIISANAIDLTNVDGNNMNTIAQYQPITYNKGLLTTDVYISGSSGISNVHTVQITQNYFTQYCMKDGI